MTATQPQPPEAVELKDLKRHDTAEEDIPSDEPPPNAVEVAERWNYPKGNIGRLGFAFLSFIIAGMNDAAIGVRIHNPLSYEKKDSYSCSIGLAPICMAHRPWQLPPLLTVDPA